MKTEAFRLIANGLEFRDIDALNRGTQRLRAPSDLSDDPIPTVSGETR